MPDNAVLGTVIGLAFLFFLFSMLCSAVVEFIANLVNKRPKFLLRGLSDLLDTPAGAEDPPNPKSVETLWNRFRAVRDNIKAERLLYRLALASGAGTNAKDAEGSTEDSDTKTAAAKAKTAVEARTRNASRWTLELMTHPLVTPSRQSGMGGQQTRNPSYLSSKTFAAALIDLIDPDAKGSTTLATIRRRVSSTDTPVPSERALLSLLNAADDNLATFRTSLEGWYDGQMDRINGSYKRWTKRWAIVIGLSVALVLQVDAIAVGTQLYTEGPLRQAVVAAATNNTLCEQNQSPQETRDCVTRELASLHTGAGLPIGWDSVTTPTDPRGWLIKVFGWVLTAMAASLGAPFWFDALSRLGSLRNAGTKPASTT